MRESFKMDSQGVFINADDLGYSEEVNEAIHKSYQLGLIQSSSLIVNMRGFDDAVQIIHANPFMADTVGLHFNLTEGYPLVDAVRDCKRFCDENGYFIFKRNEPLFRLTNQEKTAIYQEMVAQMETLRAAGIHARHIDSHHHIHTEWPILNLAIRLAKKYDVPRIRLARNMGLQPDFFKRRYRRFLNAYIKYRMGMRSSDLFGDLDDYKISAAKGITTGKFMEIMVHPKMDENRDFVMEKGNSFQKMLSNIFPVPSKQ
jgi:chitin disaccharide deacetylase